MSAFLKDMSRETFLAATYLPATAIGVIPLDAEELEAVIATGGNTGNHIETCLAAPAELDTEELEAVIAPGSYFLNHNETFLAVR